MRRTALMLVGWVGLGASGSEVTAQDRPLTAQFEEVYRVGGVLDGGHLAFQIFGPDGRFEHFVKMSRGPAMVWNSAASVADTTGGRRQARTRGPEESESCGSLPDGGGH